MNTIKVTFTDNTGKRSVLVSVYKDTTIDEDVLTTAIIDQHHTTGTIIIDSWDSIGSSEVNINSVIAESLIRMLVMTIIGHLLQRFMHRYVFPKHSWLLFPFNRYYKRTLEANNASRMIPGFFLGIIKPRFIPKES